MKKSILLGMIILFCCTGAAVHAGLNDTATDDPAANDTATHNTGTNDTNRNDPAQAARQNPGEKPVGGIQKNILISYPVYRSEQELADAVSDIYEGEIVNIFFDIRDLRSGKTMEELGAGEQENADLELYTVYEVAVTESYKGAYRKTKYVNVMGGMYGYQEAEQQDLLKKAGKDPIIPIIANREYQTLQIGQTYLFCVNDMGSKYQEVPNLGQFAFPKEKKSDQEEYLPEAYQQFGYDEMKSYGKKYKSSLAILL